MGAVSAVQCFSSVREGAARSARLRIVTGPFASVLSELTSEFIQGLQYKHKM